MTQCTWGSIDLDFGYTFRVERFIAVPVLSQVILIYGLQLGRILTYKWRKARLGESRCRVIRIYMDVEDLVLYKQRNL